MRRLAPLLALLLLVPSARPAAAGLDLTWNACNTSASGADNVALSCSTSGTARLFGNFQSPQAIPQFLAMDAVIDIRTGGGSLPPFWHFENGGCNGDGLGLSDARPSTQCPSASNATLWGSTGNDAVAAITAFDLGRGADRLRILITISRSSATPANVTAAQNYFAFVMDFFTDNAPTCGGCATPAVIGWSKAVLYGASSTVELYQAGNRLATVGVNGGLPGPTVFTVRPEMAENNAPASVDVFGRNLVSGTTARLTRSGQADITGTGTTTSTKNDLLHTTFNIVGKPDGLWNVQATDPGSATNTLSNAFRTIGGFTVDSLFPRLGDIGLSAAVTIYGTQLAAPASVRLKRTNQPDIMGTGTTVAGNGTSLQTTFGLQLAEIGSYDVEVTNGNGGSKTLSGGFDVVLPLEISAVSPNAAPDTGVVVVDVGGAGMRSGASALLRKVGQPDNIGQVLSVNPLGTSLQARFDLLNHAHGVWDLVITNPGGLPVTAGNVFLILSPPTVTSIAPNVGVNITSVSVTITGANFLDAASARLTRIGQPAISGATQVAPGGASLTTTFDLNGHAAGFWDVEVVNPGELIGRLPAAFEIRDGLHVTAVTPAAALDTSVVNLVISGSNIQSGATTKLARAGEADIVGTSVTVAPGGGSLTASFDIRGRAAGSWVASITNPDASSASFEGFTIQKIPAVTAIAPAFGTNQQTVSCVITGTKLVSGLSAMLQRVGSGPTITGDVTAVSPVGTSAQATFDLTGQTLGFYDVVVVNPGNYTSRLVSAFQIRPGAVLTGVSPALAVDTSVVTVVITGSNIAAGATAKLARNGDADIVASSVVVAPAGTSLSAVLDIRGRPGGLWNVVVANPSSIEVTAPTQFKITKIPTLTSITPAFGSDAQFLTATVTGGPFVSGVTVSLEHPPDPIIVGFVGGFPGQITTLSPVFDLRGAALAVYDVVVVNPGNFSARLPAAFEVRSGPHLVSSTPSSAPDTSVVTLTVTGSNLQPGATAKLTHVGQADIPGTAVVVGAGGTSLTAAFDVRGRLADAWNVMVTNPDGLSALLPGAFLVQKVPVVTAIAPTFVTDEELLTATITGSQFVTGVTVRLERAPTPPIAGVVSTVNPAGTSLDASFDLLHAAPPAGFYDVVVVNPGNIEGRLPAAFEVRTVPHIISFSPTSGVDSTVVFCTIVGRLFDADATARLVAPSLPTIVGTGTVVSVDRNSVTTTFDLRGEPLGPRTLEVVQHDGTALPASVAFWLYDHTLVSVPTPAPNDALALASVAPNPTRGPATAVFTLPRESAVRVSVVDLQGRELAEVASGEWPAGRHEVRWDGRGRIGDAPTGIYFLRMEAVGRTFMKRFVLMR